MHSRPNILYIMSDDHASNAISVYGSRLAEFAPTPNIDRIASEGVRLDNCHCANSICTPSRATILTGQHSHVNGVKTLANPLPEDRTCVSELLQGGGYQTAVFGKWHLYAAPRGFDQWGVHIGQGEYNDSYFLFDSKESAPDGTLIDKAEHPDWCPKILRRWINYGEAAQVPGYATDVTTDMSLDWLRNRDSEKPFFLCCQFKAPHGPFTCHPRDEDLFDDVEFPEPETLFEDDEVRKEISRKYGSSVSTRITQEALSEMRSDPNYVHEDPAIYSGPEYEAATRQRYQDYLHKYLRTVRGIDDNVGRILDYLAAEGLADNTLVIYTSDQGMMLGEHDKNDKRWIFDESMRMPFLARLPGSIASGSVNDDMIDNTDFAPTFLDYAGLSVSEDMQGRSMRPVIEGSTPADWRERVYYRYWMHMAHHGVPAHYGIRTKKHKLAFFYGKPLDSGGCTDGKTKTRYLDSDPGFELYDLEKDPLEKRNVFNDPAYASIRDELMGQLLEMKDELGDGDEAYPEVLELREKLWMGR